MIHTTNEVVNGTFQRANWRLHFHGHMMQPSFGVGVGGGGGQIPR